jgi:5-methylcytosine-specific restriction protein A
VVASDSSVFLSMSDMANAFPSINVGDVIDNARLQEVFGCSPQGGMRRALKTNTLVLISNHVKSIYEDRWMGNTLHYTGMGLLGDQSLNAAQNKTLNESNINAVGVHLFEVFVDKKYTYQGKVDLAGTPYQEPQTDQEGNIRNVWVFPVQLCEGMPVVRAEEAFWKQQANKEKKASQLSDEELETRANNAPRKPGTRNTQSTRFERDPSVSALTKRRANGTCELCEQPAPFNKKNGEPFLETHHIIWLAQGGEDSLGNTVALCPNCHRRMHALNAKKDIKTLIKKSQ